MKYLVYKILKYSLKPFYRLIFWPKYVGVNNIPSTGPFVMAGNHTSAADAAVIVSTPKRIIHTLSKKELFNTKFKNWFFRNMACIPVDRSIHDENAKSEAIETLKEGHAVGIFPEGTRNRTIGTKDEVSLLPFKPGAVKFALASGAPLLPFAVTGKHRIFRKGLKIEYGKTYYPKTNDVEKETEVLRNKILKLKEGGSQHEK